MAKKTRSKKKKYSGVDPEYLMKQKASLRRVYRKSVLFNQQELSMINEYCSRFGVNSRSALIRKAVMEKVLEELEANQPKLF